MGVDGQGVGNDKAFEQSTFRYCCFLFPTGKIIAFESGGALCYLGPLVTKICFVQSFVCILLKYFKYSKISNKRCSSLNYSHNHF